MARVVVIGAGFGGISAAAYLARDGHEVTVFEKNAWVGGRARTLQQDGFTFDMGPSWYWMPDEHDRWFRDLGHDRRDHYQIHRVDPSYRAYFGDIQPHEPRNVVDMPADAERAAAVFESFEAGAGDRFRRHLAECARNYEFSIASFIYKNYYSVFDLMTPEVLGNLPHLHLLQSYGGRIERIFRHPYLRRMLEFPVVFLGSNPRRTPAVYTLMNHIDFNLGTWYPDGGFGRVVQSMQRVAESFGARFHFERPVRQVVYRGRRATGVDVSDRQGNRTRVAADIVVANADYHHVETQLLDRPARSISARRWNRVALAPAVLNFYLGLDTKLPELRHHTFFFDTDWDAHFAAVYRTPRWIEAPLFYAHMPSYSDPSAAPPGGEALFILVPVAAGLQDTPELRSRYLEVCLDRIAQRTGRDVRGHIVMQRSMAASDFVRDYHAYRGQAFGLGQTLLQTAYFRLANRSRRLRNLYYAGQFTVPGTGTTMSMISGRVVTERIAKEHGRLESNAPTPVHSTR